jgi:hypothetical protein
VGRPPRAFFFAFRDISLLAIQLSLTLESKRESQMKQSILTIIFVAVYISAVGQILNVDRNRVLTDTAKFVTGSVAFKFHLDNKNASPEDKNSYISLENKNDLIFVGLKNNYILISQLKYFNSTGGTFISSGYGHARANFLKMRTISYEVFTQIQYDINRNMDNRFLLGGGPRWTVFNNDRVGFFIGTHLMYEHERWDNPENENQFIVKDLAKFSGYLSVRWQASKNSTFRTILYYQTGHDPDPGVVRNRLSYDIQFDMGITEKLLFSIKLSGAYEDKPIYPINRFVYSVENGLAWAF